MWLRCCINEFTRLGLCLYGTKEEAEAARHAFPGFCCAIYPVAVGQEIVLERGRDAPTPPPKDWSTPREPTNAVEEAKQSFKCDLSFIPSTKLKL